MWQSLIGGIVRHLLTTAAGMMVANGLVQGSQSQDVVGAGMLFFGIGWSAYQKYIAHTTTMPMPDRNVLSMFVAFIVAMTMLGGFNSAKADPLCIPTKCNGPFVGATILGLATNADVSGTGTVAGGNSLGLDFGYQFASSNWYFAPTAMFAYTINGGPVVGSNSGQVHWFASQGLEIGGLLTDILGNGQTPVTIPQKIANALISPYAYFGAAERNFGVGWATGMGAKFVITSDDHSAWLLNLRYMYVNYGNATVNAVQITRSENLGMIGIEYAF